MNIVYKYIKKFGLNEFNKIRILDLGENNGKNVNKIRKEMFICVYDLLYFNSSKMIYRYNNIESIDNFNKNIKYDFVIINDNIKCFD